jgi:hypothetical protein
MLTDRLSKIFSLSDFQEVFLGILESASIRSVKSGMLREIGRRNPSIDGVSYWFSELGMNLRKEELWKSSKASKIWAPSWSS